eukprot:1316342-Amorphochlora_amoeboformis.AAC.2
MAKYIRRAGGHRQRMPSEYELQREENIRRNAEMLRKGGFLGLRAGGFDVQARHGSLIDVRYLLFIYHHGSDRFTSLSAEVVDSQEKSCIRMWIKAICYGQLGLGLGHLRELPRRDILAVRSPSLAGPESERVFHPIGGPQKEEKFKGWG